MAELRGFLGRHALVAGFVGVLIPLLVLLALQSVWLHRLERTSALAQKAALSNYLEAVVAEVERSYASAAERALAVPSSYFTRGVLEKVAFHWTRKPIEGVERLFLVDFTRERFGNYLVFDPEHETLYTPPASDESLAIIVATTPWQILSYRDVPVESPSITVDERNPEFRIILNPITDDSSRLVGIAGMILDQAYFKRELLPALARKTRAAFFPEAQETDLSVTVSDARRSSEDGPVHAATRSLSFVFSDWKLCVDARDFAPERWAPASFAFNMTLSGLLAALLLGGILLALRTANRAMALSEMKSVFVSNISHELRTPLASIRVFSELLRLGKVASPERIREYGEYIEAESRRLSRLIDNILDFSRIESGRKTYRFQRGSLGEVVASALRDFEVRLKHGGFAIDFQAPREVLPDVDMDADAIGQAVHNLLDNAVKYSGDSKRIEVGLEVEDRHIVVSVRDRGIGIPREEQERIFDRFHRVSTGLVHDVKGSGLGLSIVRHIVKAHGGSTRVVSEPGKGSTFFLRIPVPRQDARAESAASGHAVSPPSEA